MKESSGYFLAACVIFAVLSIWFNWQTVTTGGYFSYIDRTPIYDLTSFREDFTSIFKSFQGPDLDATKRVVCDWILLIIDWETYDRIWFAAFTFAAFVSMYYISLKIMENEKWNLDEFRKNVAAFTAAFFYVVNPLSLEHFFAYYPQMCYALFPVAFYFLYMALKTNRNSYAILFGALSAFLFVVIIHNALYLALIFACMAAAALALKLNTVSGVLKAGLKSLAVFIALSLFLILPFIYLSFTTGIPGPNYINSIGYIEQVGANANLSNILLLDINLHTWPLLWEGYEYPFGDFYYITMAVLVIGAFAGIFYYRNFISIACALGFIIFSLLAMGINAPWGEAYLWLIFNAPLGWLMRASPKFTFILPLLFSFLILNLVSHLPDRKKLFSIAVILILVHQSVFCWPLWTGNLDGRLMKYPANPEFFEVAGILKEDEDYGMALWFGSDIRAVPRENMNYLGSRNLAVRYLVDNPNPSVSVSQMTPALGVKYIIMDQTPTAPYGYLAYAAKSIPQLDSSFEKQYSGERYVVFNMDEDNEMFYIPKTAFLVFSGYDSIHAISRQVEIGKDVALIIGDDYAGITDDSDAYTDVVVFDSKFVPFVEKSGFIKINDFEGSWVVSQSDKDNSDGEWLGVAEEYGLKPDQHGFDSVLFYSTEPKRYSDTEDRPFLEIENKEITDIFSTELVSLNNSDSIKISGETEAVGTDAFWFSLNFYDEKKEFIGNYWLAEGGKKSMKFGKYPVVPEGAEFFSLFVLSHSPVNETGVILKNLKVARAEYEYSSLDMPFSMENGGNYDLYLRIFKSPAGGKLAVILNGAEPGDIDTKSDITGFEWVKIYSGPLLQQNSMSILNKKGFNAVNAGYYTAGNGYDIQHKGVLYIYEAENEFEIENTTAAYNASFSNGIALALNKSSSAASDLHLYDNRTYKIYYEGENVKIDIDGNKAENEIYLEKGKHSIEISALSENAVLDYLLIYDSRTEEIFAMLNNDSIGEKCSINYERTGRSSYIVNAIVNEPCMLVFTSGYDRAFIADSGSAAVRPFPVYSTINAFPIEESGIHHVEYPAQKWFDIGLLLSAAFFIFLVFFLHTNKADSQ